MQAVFIFIGLVAVLFILALPYLASLSVYALPGAVLWWFSNFPKGEGPKLEDVSDQDSDAILKRVEEQKRAAELHIKSELRRGFSSNVRFIELENRFENRSNLGQELNRSIQESFAEVEELGRHIELLADPRLRRFLAWKNSYIYWRELAQYRTAVIGALIGTIIGLAILGFFDPELRTVYVPSFINPAVAYSSLFGWAGGLLGLYIGRRRHASLAEAEINSIDIETHNDEIIVQDAPEEDWPEILSVPSDASSDDIRKAYKAAIRRCHPDIVANMSENIQQAALNETQRVNDAYKRARELRGF
jgi:hypothetical protein